MDDLDDALLAKAHALCAAPAFRDVVWRHHRHRGPRATPDALSTRIHPHDQMLRHSLRHWRDVNYSVSQYFNVAFQQHDAQQQLLRMLLGGRRDAAILDFACGFGRSLRFLTQSPFGGDIWASDVQHEAVDFVAETFGVHGVYSSYDPEAFRPERTFDFIWVASLFSHLPGHLFVAWLRRLAALLAPGGAVCFSVHDECLLQPGAALGDDGIGYVPASEIEELDNRAYGTTHVREAYVAGVIREAFGHDRPNYVRLARGLANEQDLYVVAREASRDLAPLAAFRKGAWGFVDRIAFEAGDVALLGWGASLDDGPVANVTVRLDGVEHRAELGLSREDVKSVLGDARLGASGWAFRHAVPPGDVFVEVGAESARGETALLYAGPLTAPPVAPAATPPPSGVGHRLRGALRSLVGRRG
ncbi:MAG TPA: class I SAM-dependent methyltransferase [Casimicrobiaceae bacterium]|nr:class I SAM-dependent methyltransferase [Casimicrobiaceae bacterium]